MAFSLDHRHEGLTLRTQQPQWLRVVMGLCAAACVLGSTGIVVAGGAAVFTSGLALIGVILPFVLGLGMAVAVARWDSEPWMAWARVPGAALAGLSSVLLLLLALMMSNVYAAVVPLVLGISLGVVAGWLAALAATRSRPNRITISSVSLRVASELGHREVLLERVLSVRRAGRRLAVELDDGTEVEVARGLASDALDLLETELRDACDRRRASMTEERRPPEALRRLRETAR